MATTTSLGSSQHFSVVGGGGGGRGILNQQDLVDYHCRCNESIGKIDGVGGSGVVVVMGEGGSGGDGGGQFER